MNFERMIFRSWFYLRVGYGIYIAFLIGFVSNIIVIYKLAIADTSLVSVFPHLTEFAILAVLIASPLSVIIGLYHMRRTAAFAADATVSMEANPYVYKIIPGKEREVTIPLSIMTARVLLKLAGDKLTPEEKQELEEVLAKADKLLLGHSVGLKK
ncbi:hypothetical protein E6H32_07555 [Candidatus Bathyarchaeota archaeon]|nr:MAG: hypothetical protein E6H32_07555 [Candidatus Bathyarchaeota archaeon]